MSHPFYEWLSNGGNAFFVILCFFVLISLAVGALLVYPILLLKNKPTKTEKRFEISEDGSFQIDESIQKHFSMINLSDNCLSITPAEGVKVVECCIAFNNGDKLIKVKHYSIGFGPEELKIPVKLAEPVTSICIAFPQKGKLFSHSFDKYESLKRIGWAVAISVAFIVPGLLFAKYFGWNYYSFHGYLDGYVWPYLLVLILGVPLGPLCVYLATLFEKKI